MGTQPTLGQKFSCGSTAGAIASTIVFPLNNVSARLAVDKTGHYVGMGDCFVKTFKEGGLAPFYKGYTANLPRIIISRGGEMTIFNALAERFVPEGETITSVQGLLFGGAASAVMSTLTY